MGVGVGGGMADAPDMLPGMHLLYDPARVLLEEPLGLEISVAEDVEMKRQLPEVLPLVPGWKTVTVDLGTGTVTAVAHRAGECDLMASFGFDSAVCHITVGRSQ